MPLICAKAQQADQLVLRQVAVLELIDVDVVPALLVLAQHIRLSPPQLFGEDQQVIEIDAVIGAQQLLILLVDARRHFLCIPGRQLCHLVWTLQIILGPRDRRLYGERPVLLLIQVQVSNGLLDEHGLVAGIQDHERPVKPQWCEIVGLDAQHARANGMKGADHHLFGLVDAHQLFQPLAHLPGRLIGEGDRQDTPGRYVFLLHHIGNAVRNYPRLPAARPRQYQQWPLRRSHRSSLRLIESGQ